MVQSSYAPDVGSTRIVFEPRGPPSRLSKSADVSHSTRYLVISAPPLLAGALKRTRRDEPPYTNRCALTGVSGCCRGGASDAGCVGRGCAAPRTFTAATRTEYDSPDSRSPITYVYFPDSLSNAGSTTALA